MESHAASRVYYPLQVPAPVSLVSQRPVVMGVASISFALHASLVVTWRIGGYSYLRPMHLDAGQGRGQEFDVTKGSLV